MRDLYLLEVGWIHGRFCLQCSKTFLSPKMQKHPEQFEQLQRSNWKKTFSDLCGRHCAPNTDRAAVNWGKCCDARGENGNKGRKELIFNPHMPDSHVKINYFISCSANASAFHGCGLGWRPSLEVSETFWGWWGVNVLGSRGVPPPSTNTAFLAPGSRPGSSHDHKILFDSKQQNVPGYGSN